MHKKHTYTFHDEIEVNASQVSVLSPWGLIFLCALQFDLMEIGKLSFCVPWALLIVNLIASFINILSSCHPLQSAPSSLLPSDCFPRFSQSPLCLVHSDYICIPTFTCVYLQPALHLILILQTLCSFTAPYNFLKNVLSHIFNFFLLQSWLTMFHIHTTQLLGFFFFTYLCCCGIFMLISDYIET